jgi:hypothetical protein
MFVSAEEAMSLTFNFFSVSDHKNMTLQVLTFSQSRASVDPGHPAVRPRSG